jgi:RNA polymerase sigma factor (TIGR02999 family)
VEVRVYDAPEAPVSSTVWSDLYPELKRLAHARLRNSGPMTLVDTTGLVNEAYLRLAKLRSLDSAPPAAFLAYASRAMRSIIIDMVRERKALRRGGDLSPVTLDTNVIDAIAVDEDTPLRIDDALQALARVDKRLSDLVEMRYFGGFTEAEIGAALGVTERTVQRDWRKASALLRAMLQES